MSTIDAAISRFRELHRKRKSDSLSPSEQIAYAELREEFARAMLLGQRLTLQAGQTARQSLRVAHAMKVSFRVPAKMEEKTVTIDLGMNGFAALGSGSIPVGTVCDFALGSSQSLRGTARVVGSTRHGRMGGAHRISFAIQTMSDAEREQLEMVVLDAVLATLQR
jgi:hypothetical protein